MSFVSRERFHAWVENDNKDAIAVVGLPIENLNTLIATNRMPANYPNTFGIKPLPYQLDLLKDGGYLYYSFAQDQERLKQHNPELTTEMEKYPRTAEELADASSSYAHETASLRYIFEQTGIIYQSYKSLLAAAAVLFPSIIRRQKDADEFNIDWGGIDFIDEALKKPYKNFTGFDNLDMPLSKLKTILMEAINRRGVLVYYNSKIFEHQLMHGVEGEYEVLIVSQEMLSSDVVSGVRLLSPADKRAVKFPR